MQLLTEAHPEDPALDMALSHALLDEVAAGERPGTARIYRPGPTMAFGRLDRLAPGWPSATSAARTHGFTPVLRLGGGRAAAYDHGSVVVELVTRSPVIAEGMQERFAAGTGLVSAALAGLGAAVELGELPGEYCAGRWSLHLPGGPKVAGAAQRVVRGAALFTAVVVVEGGPRIRSALVDVYAALDLPWEPRTAGAAEDGRRGLTSAAVAAALARELRRQEASPGEPGPRTHAAAGRLRSAHTA